MNIEQLRALYTAAVDRFQAARTALDELPDTSTADEVDAATAEVDESAAEVERTRGNVEHRERIERIHEQNPRPEPAAADSPISRTAGSVQVNEPRTYREHGGASFFSDLYRSQRMLDANAGERLARHMREALAHGEGTQQRDVGTSAFAGLTVPQYLIDLWAPLARAGSPFLNTVRGLPLPASGMVLSISRITTGAGVAAQSAENAAVQETNIDDTKLDIDVRTYAGMQDVSRQALERSEMVDTVVFGDLIADYWTQLDSAVINADGTSGTHLGVRSTGSITSVTYTDASPTVSEAVPKIADAIQQINALRFMAATTIYMHPRRWGWFTAAVDTAGRPLVVPNSNGPWNAVAVGEAAGYGQVVGTLMGLPVVTDANIPTNLGAGTNEDLMIIARTPDALFWREGDGQPRQARFEETLAGNLTIKLVVYGYSAFSAGRYPKAFATIGGTGLVTPAF